MTMSELGHTVGQVARMARVSVRTLHHYDEIGLLTPTGRSEAGYRLYGSGDVERLHAVLLLRELGLPLEEIRTILDQAPEARLSALARTARRTLGATIRRAERRRRAYREPEEWTTHEHGHHDAELRRISEPGARG
jgi:DNA-binding transcriptional MerR regulator